MATAQAEMAVPAQYGEHLDAVISGRLRRALLLTFIILAVELAGAVLSHSAFTANKLS